jgi:hypothetical protein
MKERQDPVDGQGREEARAAQRRPAMAPSTLRARGLTATDVVVVDLSQTGARIRAEAYLAIGDEISIGLCGVGARRAYVAWQRDGDYGCAFDAPLEPHEVTQAFSSASVVRLGTSAQVKEAVAAGNNADLQTLYGRHSAWRLPWDAVGAVLGYGLLFGWLTYRFLI